MSTETTIEPAPERQLLGDRYELGEQIGKSRVGAIHAAVDTQTGERVAVKLISPLFIPSARSYEFLAAQLERRREINHPNIVRLLDYGKMEGTAAAPSLFLALEYVEGPTLQDRIALLHTAPFTLRQVFRLLLQIAKGASELHSKGIILCDLNPRRILLAAHDTIKLPAYSYISSVQWIKDPMNHTAATAIDYRYAAPEMFDDGIFRLGEAAADMYLFGILAFQLSCGIVPYEANRETLIQLHRHEPVPDTLQRSNIPEWYQQLVASSMAKNPDERISFAEIVTLLTEKLESTEAEILDSSPVYVHPNGIRVLFVEDNKLDQLSFARFAKNQRCPFTYKIARSVENAEQMLESREVDVVVSDFMLPDGTGVDVIKAAGKIPTIVLTGAGREDVAALALRAGAFDYLSKDMRCQHLAVLPQTVQRAFEHGVSQKERSALAERIRELEDQIRTAPGIFSRISTALELVAKLRSEKTDSENGVAVLAELEASLRQVSELCAPQTQVAESAQPGDNQLSAQISTPPVPVREQQDSE